MPAAVPSSPLPPSAPSGDAAATQRPKAQAAKSGPQRAMHRLGLVRDIDLALHLPMRYDDETRIVPIAEARDGAVAQVEGCVVDSRVEQRSRRQLVVRLADGSAELTLRFLNFYPAQQRALAAGERVRVRGEVRGGFLGREMVHPAFRPVAPGTPLPASLTPVYPAGAQLPQAWLRKAVESALARAPLGEVLPAGIVPAGLPTLREALHALHHPPAGTSLAALEDRSAPAWQRLKFDELLAQQLSRQQAQRERARLRAPRLVARAHPADDAAPSGDAGGDGCGGLACDDAAGPAGPGGGCAAPRTHPRRRPGVPGVPGAAQAVHVAEAAGTASTAGKAADPMPPPVTARRTRRSAIGTAGPRPITAASRAPALRPPPTTAACRAACSTRCPSG